ncbi:MAG: hypothetical protein ACR2LA_08885 [Acidimicrobiales bacterium]
MSEEEGQADTAETTTEPDTSQETATVDWQAEAEKYKGLSRKHEDRAKANADAARRLADLEKQSMSDIEKAVANAREEASTEARRSYGTRLVDAEVKAATAGRTVDVEALLDGLDRGRFLGDDGEPDTAAIGAWVDRIAPLRPGPLDLGQGVRTTTNDAPDMNVMLRTAAGRNPR